MESPLELIAQPDVIMLDVAATSREAAIRLVHGAVSQGPAIKDAGRFLRDLLERAMLSSVCIAPAVALPHARTDAVSSIVLGIARIAGEGVAFDPEHPKVRLIFLIGTPRLDVDVYLRLVAGISRLLKSDGVMAGLLAARDEPEFRAWLDRAAHA